MDLLLRITLLSPPTTYDVLSSGAGYEVTCAQGAPLFLELPADASPATSERCCSTQQQRRNNEPQLAALFQNYLWVQQKPL